MTNATVAPVATVETVSKPVFRLSTSRAFALKLFAAKLPTRATVGNTEFRNTVLSTMQEELNMTRASAAATYNIVKKYAVANKMCENFGRTPAETKAAKAPKAPKAAKAPVVTTVNVARVKDGAFVAENVTVAEAEAIIAKATKQKKAKLVIA
jgi:biotin carboxyl carrier protein